MRLFRQVKIKDIIFNNFWLKVIALITAIVVWVYVTVLINKEGSKPQTVSASDYLVLTESEKV